MIHIMEHEGLRGSFLDIVKWVKQFSNEWKLVQVKDLPLIENGIILVMDLPIRPTAAIRIDNPLNELGQTEAQILFDYVLPTIKVPIVSFGSFSVAEMIGCRLEYQSNRRRPKKAQVKPTFKSPIEWYWGDLRKDVIITGFSEETSKEVLATYGAKSEIDSDICAIKSKNIWVSNLVPYLMENWKSSHYKKMFGYEIGDPVSNLIMGKAYRHEKESI